MKTARLIELEQRLKRLTEERRMILSTWYNYGTGKFKEGAPLRRYYDIETSLKNTFCNINQEKQRIEKKEREEAKWRENTTLCFNEDDAVRVINKYIKEKDKVQEQKDLCEACKYTHSEGGINCTSFLTIPITPENIDKIQCNFIPAEIFGTNSYYLY
jgi:hypothetical protein